MEHLDALAPTDEELMSLVYDEGTLPQEEREHLEHCPICQQRLATFTRTTELLHTKLYRSLCPSAVDLNYYCLGGLPEKERISIASHLLNCPLCADEVEEIRREQANFDLYPSAAFLLPSAVRRIFAKLVVLQAQPVLRDDLPGTGWPRQYKAGEIDLSLHLSRTSDGETMLLGIITSSSAAETVDTFEGVAVDLYSASGPLPKGNDGEQQKTEDATPLLSTQVDDVGNIFLEPVPPGDYVMIIHLPDQEVVIEGLTINHG
jgi:hypothetical protein